MSSQIVISSMCMKSVESLYKDAMRNAVLSCSEQYGFDSAEALMRLGVDSVTISVKGTKEKKAGVKKVAMPSIALPFTTCNPALCNGLKQNHGLYTQCPGAPVEGNSFCKGCIKQCEKNESGKPDNGTIEDRVKSEFKGPKGDAPKHYTAVMKKLKLTKEQVLEEAAKFGIEIDEEHFIAPATQTKRGRPSKKSADDNSASVESKKRGRPKKQPKDVKPEEVDDLFANLVSSAQEEDASETSSLSGSETSTKSKKAKLTDAEKAEKKQMAEADKEAKKAAAEKAKAEKKAAAEKEKAEKKAAAEKEKADKKAAADKEKADKKAAADQLKAEKEAKKAAAEKEKAEKKAALEAKKAEKESKPVAEKESKPKAAKKEEEAAPAPAVLKVKKFEYKGTKYLKSSNGVVYNMEQDEVGTWNEETKEIEFKAVDEEEEEEEYESDDE